MTAILFENDALSLHSVPLDQSEQVVGTFSPHLGARPSLSRPASDFARPLPPIWHNKPTAAIRASYEVAETALGHKIGEREERSCARSDDLSRRAALTQRWADHGTGNDPAGTAPVNVSIQD